MNTSRKLAIAAIALALCCAAGGASSTITGKIDAKITLTSGCVINGNNTNDGAANVQFGTLDFGSQTTLFSQADGQVQGSGQGIQVQCTAGVAPRLTFGAGQYDGSGGGGGNKAMRHATDTARFVTYTLYANAGRTDAINAGRQIALASDGSAQTVNVYGRAFGAAGLIAGNYTDVVTVTLDL
ncbi:Csu type fimbrial protein [Lysobacter enzymogenes]|uniref:Csu type fimbrial protein n=1 Tax=Lysobacter enzymogenes TaxID=69 RepID=UPI00099C5BA5|nr:spore coat U domain-containing protein [Lysobacter enzymogenes]UZW62197.1 spore coat U domain-containing protein [Lysobacter enzymogenes]